MINSQSKADKAKYDQFQFLRQKRAEIDDLIDFHEVTRST
jgi:hypothetical protein